MTKSEFRPFFFPPAPFLETIPSWPPRTTSDEEEAGLA
eukprot:CAMPEP_0183728842 /NCGR_PEP_ID=MMETSP0737-20130205/29049_1 /TAXON_ID=385413 /ORGANISM="Thalassiosira miniscula, Strain CCMP1093" /LENGTH=37 /DNA_ID= /DNA_START= /DNA_END= /DNA_ORIENTATION=